MKKQRDVNIAQKEKEIEDVMKNINMLEQSKMGLSSKTQYLIQNMNMKAKDKQAAQQAA
jgi:hypothetical protein